MPPVYEQKAMYEKDWRENKEEFKEVRKNTEGSIQLEIWNHELPLQMGYIHPVAIASTLLGERDPRIEDEVDTLIRKYLEEND